MGFRRLSLDGRLIRTGQDKAVVILDPRILTKNYGNAWHPPAIRCLY